MLWRIAAVTRITLNGDPMAASGNKKTGLAVTSGSDLCHGPEIIDDGQLQSKRKYVDDINRYGLWLRSFWLRS
jgi:hypothetical protein